MKKAGFSLGLIIASNILIIGISLVYGLHVFSFPENAKPVSSDNLGEMKELALKK